MKKPLVSLQLTLAAGLMFTAVMVVFATTTDIQTFESEFIKTLKAKFADFYNKIPQDRLYLQTDKSLYNPGETVWFSAYIRNAETLKPSDKSDIVHIELITPKGTTEKHYKVIAQNGIAQGDFDLTGHPGGIYKIKAYTEWQKNDIDTLLFEKEITVQGVVMPRLKMKLDFEKKAYGKGDAVVAKLELNTNENKPLANKLVKFKASLDGIALSENTVTTDGTGKANLQFTLPKDLNTIDGIVNAMIDFEGSTESISRSIPLVLNQVKLEFFPEGGDMVVNANARLAFRATNEFGKPADVEGIIVDSKGQFVTNFSSYHFGMGITSFTPQGGELYKAHITKPEGILNEYELPEALNTGYTLSVQDNQSGHMRLAIYSRQNEQLSVVAQTRGKIYYAKAFDAAKGNNFLNIKTADFPIGVTQITLFDSKGIARSERLAFVNRDKQLKISVTTDKKQYQPREKVNMTIRVTDAEGLPMPGDFSLAVVDDNQLSFADDKQGNILSAMLLEPELKEKVEEPNFYFDTKEEKSEKSLDLLLMTSGWRRYTWKQINDNNGPAVTHPGEMAIVGGSVIDPRTGKGYAGATVRVPNTKLVAVTDKDGRFALRGFDVAQHNQLEISAPGFSTQNQYVYAYSNNYYYYLYDGRELSEVVVTGAKYEKHMAEEVVAMDVVRAAPMQAPGFVEIKTKKERQLAKAPKAAQGGKAEERNFFAADVAVMPAPDVIEAEEKPVAAGDVAGLDDWDKPAKLETVIVVASNVDEGRLGAFRRMEGNGTAPVQFYRAKEFPKKQYAAKDTTRNDFASTIYWNGHIETDNNGKAKVEFVANDLVSSFKATVEGFAVDGSIGHGEYNFATNIPFVMDTKIPVEMVSGDKMSLPVFLKNNTPDDITGNLKMMVISDTGSNKTNYVYNMTTDRKITIPAHSSIIEHFDYTAGYFSDNVHIKFTGAPYNQELQKHINVVAKGFPANISLSGQDMEKDFAINPVNVVPGSMKVTFNAYPNIMGELMSGVESILREPYGCFEQTSSSNYPNIMVLSYLKTMQQHDPKVEERAKTLLDAGYKRLTTYETKENGYEWFGAAPAHEALTAYGLMEFQDMKKVYAGVDDKMIDRTVKLLLDKRDGNGGFKKNPRALDSFGGADEDITNAYIVYALSEAGYKDIAKEMDAVYKNARKSNDPYLMALAANALFNLGDKRAEEMVSQLISARNEAGFWTGKKHSITRSTGEGLKVETTSLILMALMKSQSPDNQSIASAVKFLVGARSGYGGFGSTQATILALKALTKYAEFSKRTDEAGTVEVLVNGIVVGSKDYAKGEKGNITITGLDKYIPPLKQKVTIRFKGTKQALPYAMNIAYSTSLPESAENCVVNLETKLSSEHAKVGETVRLSATLKNKTGEGQPMTMAIIGIPAGFTAQPWQLKEMQEKGVIDFYEIIGNNVACYYRALAPKAEKHINFDLKAEIPGEYQAPAASAYLYYTAENKDWVGMNKVTINP